jgi:aminoglycoside 6-adenylyltransferase
VRQEAEVLGQIRAFAAGDARVRAVLLNGSRASPAHTPDLLSDYDVLLSVTDVDSFARDEGWLGHFGPVLLMQRPDDPPPARAWLVVFADGVRIDFTVSPAARLAEDARADSLTRLLLDKDGRCPPLPPPDARSHFVPRPTAAEFAATCNEAWWVLVYAAKGLWRGQLPYAKHALDRIVRTEVERLLAWYAADCHGWQADVGSLGKHLPALLPEDVWRAYRDTYAGAGIEENWRALFAIADLIDSVGPDVARALGYAYDHAEGASARRLLAALRSLPPHASDLTIE